jgi:hypothetical protein
VDPFEDIPNCDLLDLLKKYNEEIKPQIDINELNIKDVQFDLPNRRHYWAGRLIYHKASIMKLYRLRKEAQKKLKQKIEKESPVSLETRSVKASVESHPIVEKIDQEIAEHELLVDYLTKIESNFRNLGFDIKNLVQLIQLETT